LLGHVCANNYLKLILAFLVFWLITLKYIINILELPFQLSSRPLLQ